MEFAAGAGVAPLLRLRPLPAGPLPVPGRNRRVRVRGGAIGIGWARRATAPSRDGRFPRREEATCFTAASSFARPAAAVWGSAARTPSVIDHPRRSRLRRMARLLRVRDHPGGIRKELMNLAVPAIVGQAIDPVAQLLETAYVGRLGPVELASAAVGMSVFNIISKLFNIPLLSITTSFVAEDVSKHDSTQSASGNISGKIGERKRLPSISSALLLAAAIVFIEALL